MPPELLKGHVLKVLSPYKVLINLGRQHGVGKGMKFIIYEEGDMIYDPKSGKPVEKLELVKGEVEVVHVQEKMSAAASFETEKRIYRPIWDLSMFRPTTETVKIKKELTEEKIKEPLPSNLKAGDLVRQLQ